MYKYTIRIGSAYFEDIEVEAENRNEAIELAISEFTGDCPEFEEIIKEK